MRLIESNLKLDWYDSEQTESTRRNLEIKGSVVVIVSVTIFWVLLMVAAQMLIWYYCKLKQKRGTCNEIYICLLAMI